MIFETWKHFDWEILRTSLGGIIPCTMVYHPLCDIKNILTNKKVHILARSDVIKKLNSTFSHMRSILSSGTFADGKSVGVIFRPVRPFLFPWDLRPELAKAFRTCSPIIRNRSKKDEPFLNYGRFIDPIQCVTMRKWYL